MKNFFKFLLALAGVFTAVIGALAVFDRFSNRNRLRGNYLDCDIPTDEMQDDEEEM